MKLFMVLWSLLLWPMHLLLAAEILQDGGPVIPTLPLGIAAVAIPVVMTVLIAHNGK